VPDRDAGDAPRAARRSRTPPRDLVIEGRSEGSSRALASEREPDEHRDTRGDAIPAEGPQVVRLDEAQERTDHDECADERGEEAHGQGDRPARVEIVATLPEREEAGGVERRESEEERELGGRAALETDDQAGEDGRARA